MKYTRFKPRRKAGALRLLGALSLLGATLMTAPAQASTGYDLRHGAVFAMSNAPEAEGGNEVVAYARNSDGTLDEKGRFPTGGHGSGSFEDAANALVLGTYRGEAGPNNLIELADGGRQLLFAANPGSNTISVFAVHAHLIELIDVQPSGGEKPVSVTVNDGRVYVLNSGETTDELFDDEGGVIPTAPRANNRVSLGLRSLNGVSSTRSTTPPAS